MSSGPCVGFLPGREHLYNRAFLPLAERLRDFLITRFHLKPNGRRQELEGDVVVHLPSVLAYDLHDGETAANTTSPPRRAARWSAGRCWRSGPSGCWRTGACSSGRGKRAAPGKSPAPQKAAAAGCTQEQLEAEGRRVAQLYESSTSWKVTRPLRALARLWEKGAPLEQEIIIFPRCLRDCSRR